MVGRIASMECQYRALFFLASFLNICTTELIIYEHPDGVLQSDKFSVTLQQTTEEGARSSFVYMSESNNRAGVRPFEAKPDRTVSWTSFAFEGEPVTALISTRYDFETCIVRPVSYGFSCQRISSNTAEVIITHNTRMMSVEFDNDAGTSGQTDIVNKLLIFADDVEHDVPNDINSPHLLYYEKGVHDLGGQKFLGPEIREVYISQGAYVHGAFNTSEGHQGCKIYGRGIISGERYAFKDPNIYMALVLMDKGRNHEVNGLVLVDPTQFYVRILSPNSRVSNIKTVAPWNFNSDGIVVKRRGQVKDSFIMANDDSLKIYGNRLEITRCVIWQSHNGGVLQFGWWRKRNLRRVRVSDIDVIHTDWCAFKGNRCHVSRNSALIAFGQGTTRINIRDVEIRDVRLEGICPRLINFTIQSNARGSINNIRLINWSIQQDRLPRHSNLINKIAGNQAITIENWKFKNFVIDGQCIRNLAAADIETEFTNTSFECD